ncbi:MAG: hypothetical protein ABFS35_09805 [Bacteroidota bacterium]
MKYVIFLIVFSFSIACNSSKKTSNVPLAMANAPVLIYKTTNNYIDNVPISLSPDKKEIVSYPHPTDLKNGDYYSIPTKLKGGYLLDNRGVSSNTAFLKLTYKEYAELETAPSLTKLKSLIIDNNPFTRLYHCGKRSDFNNLEKDLNEIIKKNNFNRFKRLK